MHLNCWGSLWIRITTLTFNTKESKSALEENDVVNKMFLQTHIEKAQKEIIEHLKDNINEIHEIILNMRIIFEEEIKMIREQILKIDHLIKVIVNENALTTENH